MRSLFRVLLLASCAPLPCAVAAVHLQTDHRTNPLGIDDAQPAFSWQSDATARDWKQGAYQVMVASTPQLLKAGHADVWDSGRRESAQSVDVAYGGPALASGHRYYWSVRVWDAHGAATLSGEPALWEMGLLAPADWKAAWVGADDGAQQELLQRIQWIWLPNSDAQHVKSGTAAEFRYTLHLDKAPQAATLHVFAGGVYSASVNGVETGHKDEWGSFDREAIRNYLRYGSGAAGDNVIAVKLRAPRDMAAALAAAIDLRDENGRQQWLVSGDAWQARTGDGAWSAAHALGSLPSQHFGVAPDRNSPAPTPTAVTFGASLLRKDFDSAGAPVSARLYVTALGAYRAFVNGKQVSDDWLTPGFTDYRKRVLYQTYDVTRLVSGGHNTLGAMLGEGWHGSPLLWSGSREFAGRSLLRAQLVLTYRDGSQKVVATDKTWQTAPSPITSSTIYGGEDYDARMEQSGWAAPGFQPTAAWSAAVVGQPDSSVAVSAQTDAPVHQQLFVNPIAVTTVHNTVTNTDDAVFNMGQNMAGVVRLHVRGQRGTLVRLRFAERLNPDGTVYTENLRDADATDTYTLSGNGEEQWTPAFTFHGFQYVEVEGYPGKPSLTALQGLVLNSLPQIPAMRLATTSTLLNSMDKLGLWGQRGNFISIPTDCPQRDERMGWMGDAGVFWRTGSYNFDIDAFSHKFVQDEDDAQTTDGAFTNISPNLLFGNDDIGAPGWGDAGVIVPYSTWMQYGDTAVLRQAWPGMVRWMDFILKNNPDYVRAHNLGPNYGDWLAPDPHTPADLIGTAYWALVAQQMQTMATALNKPEDAAKYGALYGRIRDAYGKRYIHADGSVEGDTESSYVVTLAMKLAPQELEANMTDRLVHNIAAHGNHLTTGFLATPFLLSVLDDHGRTDVAYSLLLTTGYPSWGYMVSKGATTWWERWNGDTGDPSMNSYNHYSFGSVMAWVYRRVAGIDTDAAGPGYRHIVVHPEPDARLPHQHASYDSQYGTIETDWTLDAARQGGAFHLTLRVPPNSTATVELPAKESSKVMRDGQSVTLPYRNGAMTSEVGAGLYRFDVKP